MLTKVVNRNIPEYRENSNDRFRVRYKDKSKFEILIVNICRLKTNEIQTFEFKSTELPDQDSIHFSTSIEKGKLKVNWREISNIPKPRKKTESSRFIENKKEKKEIESFFPVVCKQPKVLILGTMPGKESLRLNEYYANSRNIFWRIIYTLHNIEVETDYKSKTDFLKQKGISIWDVCHTAVRESSLDIDIKDETPNNIKDLINSNPTIKTIAFNGQKAEKLYDKYNERSLDIKYLTLLSTSPANTSYTFTEKLEDWKRIIKTNS